MNRVTRAGRAKGLAPRAGISHKSVNLPIPLRAAFSKNVYYMFRFSKSVTSALHYLRGMRLF